MLIVHQQIRKQNGTSITAEGQRKKTNKQTNIRRKKNKQTKIWIILRHNTNVTKSQEDIHQQDLC